MVKIGAELPKLSQNKTGYPFFWTTLYIADDIMHSITQYWGKALKWLYSVMIYSLQYLRQ